MDHTYQFAIQKYNLLRINEIKPRQKIECIYCRRDDGKGGERRMAKNAIEI